MYRKYSDENKVWAYNLFIRQDFVATVILDNDDFLIFDWGESSGSGTLAARYILDKQKGQLTIYGDSGDCTACWYGKVTAEDMEAYVNSIGYFIEKMHASTDKFSYAVNDIKADFECCKKQLLEDSDDETDAEQFEEDMQQVYDWLIDNQHEAAVFDEKITDILDKYCDCWWESGVTECGKRVAKRVYLWSVGYQMAIAQLKEKKRRKKC